MTMNKLKLLTTIYLLLFNFSLDLYGQQWTEASESIGGVVDFVIMDETIYTISNLGLFAYSTDDCETWTIQDIRDASTLETSIFTSIVFFDENHGIIGIRDGFSGNQIIQTQDGGVTWEVTQTSYGNCSDSFIPIDLAKLNDSTAILSLHLSGMYFITHDKGLNWTCNEPFYGPDWVQVKTFRSETEWIFNGSNGLYKTLNAGETWELLIDRNFAYYHEGKNNELYGLTWPNDEPNETTVLYKSVDDFLTYETIELQQFSGEYIDLFLYESDDNIYIRQGGKNIYQSIDGAQNFELIQTLSNEPFRTERVNDTWYISGRGLWKIGEGVVSTERIEDQSTLTVYPNPTSSIIYLDNLNNQSYTLLNSNGQIAQSGIIKDQKIEILNQSKGIYFLKVKKGDSFLIERITIF